MSKQKPTSQPLKTPLKDSSPDNIRTHRVNSWEELQKELFTDWWGDGIDRYRTKRLFRGLSDSAYPLQTGIQRMSKGLEAGALREEYLKKIEPLMLRNFQKYAQIDKAKGDTVWHLLTIAQHHRLPTRLLDWTNSLFVALHFVTRNVKHYDKDGVVWAVNFLDVQRLLSAKLTGACVKGARTFAVGELNKIAPSLEVLDRIKDPCLIFFEPPSIDERIINQYSLSSVMPGAAVERPSPSAAAALSPPAAAAASARSASTGNVDLTGGVAAFELGTPGATHIWSGLAT